MNLTRLFLITGLVLSGGPVAAAWVPIDKKYQEPGLQTVYVDPATIRREGKRVTVWQLTDYKWMQGNPRGTPRFLSTTTHKEFDCAAKRVRLLAFTQFPYHMGTGRPAKEHVDKDHWFPVQPASINHALWNVACRKQ
jgi:hypothetical protein